MNDMKEIVRPPEFADWQVWGEEEPFEDYAGPFFFRKDDNGNYVSGFLGAPQHMNGGGYLHGGMLMSFADYALFVIAFDELADAHAVTISCQTEFLKGAAPLGQPIYADGAVTRNTRSLVFVRGRVYTGKQADEQILATFSGILKKMP